MNIVENQACALTNILFVLFRSFLDSFSCSSADFRILDTVWCFLSFNHAFVGFCLILVFSFRWAHYQSYALWSNCILRTYEYRSSPWCWGCFEELFSFLPSFFPLEKNSIRIGLRWRLAPKFLVMLMLVLFHRNLNICHKLFHILFLIIFPRD